MAKDIEAHLQILVLINIARMQLKFCMCLPAIRTAVTKNADAQMKPEIKKRPEKGPGPMESSFSNLIEEEQL